MEPATDGRAIARSLKPFAEPSVRRSTIQLVVTAVAFVGFWVAMWLSLEAGYWLTLLLAVPAAGFLVRLFIIQHDCGHGSLFRSRWLNNLVGRLLGIVTMTPYDYWRQMHAVHHASNGNLDRRGIGDVTTLTVEEYRALPRWRRLVYRCYRHPLVLFTVGPIYVFVLKHRLPLDLPLSQRGTWLNVLLSNLGIVLLSGVAVWLVGPAELIMLQVPIVLLSGAAGIWLFFVQHQYDHAYWQHDDNWDFYDAALKGSSYYRLPRILDWFTAHIGIHHVHHLASRIPNYRLKECMERVPELREVYTLTLWQSLRCASLALWDEASGRMIRFRDLAPA